MSNRRQRLRAQVAEQKAKEEATRYPPLKLGGITLRPFAVVDMAFGARLTDYPPMPSIPEQFRAHSGKYQDIVSALFFRGGTLADHGLKWKAGLDHSQAMAATRALLTSWDPKHEHKTATVAWALSEWTEAL